MNRFGTECHSISVLKREYCGLTCLLIYIIVNCHLLMPIGTDADSFGSCQTLNDSACAAHFNDAFPSKYSEETDYNGSCSNVICSLGYECSEGSCVNKKRCPLVLPESIKFGCEYKLQTDKDGCLFLKLDCLCGKHASPADCTLQVNVIGCNRCVNGCLCDEGYSFVNGICSPTENCTTVEEDVKWSDICPENEQIEYCGANDRFCNGTVSIHSSFCRYPECGCKNGYLRNRYGKCVTEEECSQLCDDNEEFKKCGTVCEPTCSNPIQQHCSQQCVVNVCQCKAGYVRNDEGFCIHRSQCRYDVQR